jgi:hypothetical protein
MADESIPAENGLPDIWKVGPSINDSAGPEYYALGEALGKCYSAGCRK